MNGFPVFGPRAIGLMVAAGNQFTPVPNYTSALARSIAVEAVRPRTPSVAGTTKTGATAVSGRGPPPAGSRQSLRAAIRLQVR